MTTIEQKVEQILERGLEPAMHVIGEIKALKNSTDEHAEGMKHNMLFSFQDEQLSLELIDIRLNDAATFKRLAELCDRYYPDII